MFPTVPAPTSAPGENTAAMASTVATERHEDPGETEDMQMQEIDASTQ